MTPAELTRRADAIVGRGWRDLLAELTQREMALVDARESALDGMDGEAACRVHRELRAVERDIWLAGKAAAEELDLSSRIILREMAHDSRATRVKG